MSALRDLTLYVIRHGECEHNVAGRAASWDDSPLTSLGREQARGNGLLLREIAGELSGFGFFASPIHRTCNTMELVREAAGLPLTGYRADHRLMELHYGDHTWMTREELDRFDPRPPRFAEDMNYVRPRGESWMHLHDRVGRFLNSLTGDAIIVTHYGPACAIRAHYLGLAPADMASWRPPHAGIMRLSAGTEAFFGD